jgi:hypothetical protein
MTAARVFVALAIWLLAQPVRADVDMTGRWIVRAPGLGGLQCEEWEQNGTAVTYRLCDQSLDHGPGTIDPATGVFQIGDDPLSQYVGTVSADGRTMVGSQAAFICRITVGCFWFRFDVFGARCGGGTVDPGEECDTGRVDGTFESGRCCTSECRFEPAGSACSADTSPVVAGTCDAAGVCLPIPCALCETRDMTTGDCVPDVRPSCARPLAPRAKLSLDAAAAGEAALSWTWRPGDVPPGDLGAPDVTTGYRLCVFGDDGQGGTTIVSATEAGPAGTCGGACWQADAERTRFRYRNRRADGLTSMKLSGKRIVAKGSGAGLGLPPTLADVRAPLRVQLHRTDAPACWESGFETAAVQDARRLRARGGE